MATLIIVTTTMLAKPTPAHTHPAMSTLLENELENTDVPTFAKSTLLGMFNSGNLRRTSSNA